MRAEAPRDRRIVALALCVTLVACCACNAFKKVERRDVEPEAFQSWSAEEAADVQKKSPFLKAHMRNGDLFVLQNWSGGANGAVTGDGSHYDPTRTLLATGKFSIAIDSVAIFETNQTMVSGAAVAVTAFAVITVAVAIACAVNPKACFGSCPTFFVAGRKRPLAEGFSASIAPSLEATDVDALDIDAVRGGDFEITMKNEAYETHVVRHVDLLAVPHEYGTRTGYALDGSFYRTGKTQPPVTALASEGDVSLLLSARDGRERFSLADSTDLAARETIDLEFSRAGAGSYAIILSSRQSLLSTYLLYQTYAYMGTQAAYWLAELERGRLGDAGGGIVDVLGGIEIAIEAAPDRWEAVGEVTEFGPIATDQHLVVFDAPPAWTGRVRIMMTKGAWRIDEVTLASNPKRVTPIRLAPSRVTSHGAIDDAARTQLIDPAQSLVTLPGDAYTLTYEVPRDHTSYDLFLEGRGYYLEWIRDAWIEEENPSLLAEMFFMPDDAMVRLAPVYKRVEGSMERTFWSSRYANP